jgi:uncharacterized protein (UPF0335 family)
MTDAKLKSLAERIERLMDDRDGIQSDIREIYAEAKSAGYIPKVLRKAITRKRMDPDKRDEEDTILELYEGALSPTMRKVVEMAKAGASSHQIEAETGVDHATVARSVALNKKSATVKIENENAAPDASANPIQASRSPAIAASDCTQPVEPTGNEGCPGERETGGRAPAEPDDGLDLPPFLDRRPKAVAA